MRNLISDVMTYSTKPSSQTFHDSAFVKALPHLDVPEDLVKNVKHLRMLSVKNHRQ